MTDKYDGPTRQELVYQVLKYNKTVHNTNQIEMFNILKERPAVQQLQQYETNASESAHLLKKSIKELQDLRRHQLKKGRESSRNDWSWIKLAGKNIMEAAQEGIARHDTKAAGAAADAHGTLDDKSDHLQRGMKPTPHHTAPRQQVPASKQYRPSSPQPQSKHKAAPRLTSPRREKLANKGTKPILKRQAKKPYQPSPPQPAHRVPAQPTSPDQNVLEKPQEKIMQSAEEKERQRQVTVGQKEVEAYLQAKNLHSEVRKYA